MIYEREELLEEYRETFGELSLKKLLVDELEAYEEDGAEGVKGQEELEEEEAEESEAEVEEKAEEVEEEKEEKPMRSFKKKSL